MVVPLPAHRIVQALVLTAAEPHVPTHVATIVQPVVPAAVAEVAAADVPEVAAADVPVVAKVDVPEDVVEAVALPVPVTVRQVVLALVQKRPQVNVLHVRKHVCSIAVQDVIISVMLPAKKHVLMLLRFQDVIIPVCRVVTVDVPVIATHHVADIVKVQQVNTQLL